MASKPLVTSIFPQAAEHFAQLAAEWVGSLPAGWASVPQVFEAIREGTLSAAQMAPTRPQLEWMERHGPFPGGPSGFLLTAHIGQAFITDFGGSWFGPDAKGFWAIDQTTPCWAATFHPHALALRILQPRGSFDVAAFVAALPQAMEDACRGMVELDTPEVTEGFHDEFRAVMQMVDDELDRWAAEQASQFRDLWRLRTETSLFYDLSGIEALDQIIPSEHYLQTYSQAMLRKMACFLGECARRTWAVNDGVEFGWLWVDAHESLALVRVDRGDERSGPSAHNTIFFPFEELMARMDANQVVQQSLVEAVRDFHKRLGEIYNLADERRTRDSTDDSRSSLADLATSDGSTTSDGSDSINSAMTGVEEKPGPWRLSQDLVVNSSVFVLRRQAAPASAGANVPDLVIPCMNDLTQGARPLAIVPVEGIQFETEDELAAMLTEVAERVDQELAQNKLSAHLYIYFSRTPTGSGDLMVTIEPPTLVGGSRRLTWFQWPNDCRRPIGPLQPEHRRVLEHFKPVLARVRRALNLLRFSGDAGEARRLLEECLALDEKNPVVLMAMCSLHLAIGNQITARGFVQQLLEYDPSNVEARLLDARFLLDEGLQDKALETVQTILQRSEHPEALLIRARVRAGRGEVTEALADVERARQLDPQNEEAELLQQLLSEYLG